MWCKVTRRRVRIVLGVYNVEVTVSGMGQLQSPIPLNEALQYNYGIKQHVWQSRVEIKGYSVVYFAHVSLPLKHRIAELPLRVGLIRAL